MGKVETGILSKGMRCAMNPLNPERNHVVVDEILIEGSGESVLCVIH